MTIESEDSTLSELHFTLLSDSKKLKLTNSEVYKWVSWFIEQTKNYQKGKISDSIFINILKNYSEKVEELKTL